MFNFTFIEGGCPSPDKVSCVEGEKCGENDDCGSNEICCPNKCYNKRCIPGTKPGILFLLQIRSAYIIIFHFQSAKKKALKKKNQ